MNATLGVLRHRNFRFLAIGAGVNSLGNAITPVALAFAVLDLGGSPTELGLVVASFALAEVVTTLFGGVLGDRVPRHLMMQGSSAGAAVTQTVIAASLIGGWSSIPLLAAIGALNGVMGALSGPSSSALTPQTVPAEDLSSAVALRRLLQNGAQVLGFSVAGLLVAGFGPGWAIGIDAATFAIAGLSYHLIDVPAVTGGGERQRMLAEMREGAVEVFRHTWLWLLIGQALLYHLFYGGAQGVLGPIVVKKAIGEAAWGWALAALMAGFMLGGLLNLRWRPKHGLRIGTACLALTACFPLAMAVSDQLWVILLGAALHGLGLEIFDQNWEISIVQNVPPDKLARVFSFDVVGSFVARPLGLALTGPIATAVGYDTWLIVVAAVMGGSSLLALSSRDVRRLVRTS
ncbi:MFS transporter [Nocardioides marmorisolisilvae]|uniref:MFS transporter n=1 Tax=Nocardioides marmorisolisilvae TaxID=1542737 RepID=A0A3N0DZQ4_9ACTN|nr:MFS transporter [Nocardioides marmorisolisilvae]RNL80986.1 MFS transporter [Nocardioides marmorisolisilvae]